MEIATSKQHDTGDELEKTVICMFPKGIIGFAGSLSYEMISSSKIFPFIKLKSIDEPNLEFAIMDPWIVKDDYSITLSDNDLATLEAGESDDLAIYAIVTLHRSEAKISLNLAAPIVININKHIGIQAIVENSDLPLKFFVNLNDKF